MGKRLWIVNGLLLVGIIAYAQQNSKIEEDSTEKYRKYLPDVTVVGRNSKSDYQQMPEIVGTNIYAGKKSTLIVLDNV